MHSREDVDCHKRPRGAREYARAHSFYGASEQAACSRFCVWGCVDRPILKAPGSVLAADKKGLKIACGEGTVLRIDTLQAAGGKRMAAADYLRGHPIPVD